MQEELSKMTAQVSRAGGAPTYVTLFTPILKFLLAAGVPLGLNGLITIRGRKSGLPRTTPVAIIEVSGRRWVWCPWGDVPWLRNLRAAGGASITVRRRQEEVRATELDQTHDPRRANQARLQPRPKRRPGLFRWQQSGHLTASTQAEPARRFAAADQPPSSHRVRQTS